MKLNWWIRLLAGWVVLLVGYSTLRPHQGWDAPIAYSVAVAAVLFAWCVFDLVRTACGRHR